jgi:hypothetical protein
LAGIIASRPNYCNKAARRDKDLLQKQHTNLPQDFRETFWPGIAECQIETRQEIGQVASHQFGSTSKLTFGKCIDECMMSVPFARDITPPPVQGYD